MDAAFRECLERLLTMHEVLAAIPDHDGSAPVIPLWDDPFKILVVDRMILDLDREMLFSPLPRQSFGHSPRLQDAIHLQSKVVV